MRYLSLFSGIEAATCAWHPLGWEAVAYAEIEPFPSRKLAHAYPAVPNLGDVTQITEAQIAALGPIDIVVFGSPCQDLSVAGKRAGLAGARSGLFHTAIEIIQWARQHGGCRWALWENVPGAFSSNKGRDFAAVVGLLAGGEFDTPPKGWGTEGVCVGEEGMVEWSVLDAQWFGVAQRRRRVFALADFGDWTGRPPILLEPESVRGNPPTRSQAGEGVAGTLAARTSGGGGLLRPCVTPLGLGEDGELARALNACHTASGRHDVSVDTFVAHTLRAEGFDASEDGTGRGIPLIAFVPEVHSTMVARSSRGGGQTNSPGHNADSTLIAFNARQDPDSWLERTGPLDTDGSTQCVAFQTRGSNLHVGDISGTIGTNAECASGSAPMVAFSSKDYGADAGVVSPTLRSMGHDRSHANGGGQVAVAFDTTQITNKTNRSNPKPGDPCHLLVSTGHAPAIAHTSVRRLTPIECERLQGFPDNYTRIDGKTKDGPRYKALGNSMAVPVMRWIGQRIDLVDLVEGVYP